MTNNSLFSVSRMALITVAIALLVPAAKAQPATPMPADVGKPMPADIVKPMPADMGKPMPKTGMDMKKGMDMKQGMDMKGMMTDMQNKMSAMKPSGNVDMDFAMMMRVHHQSAVTMAESELQNGKDPQMRMMAKDIIRAQKKEIASFDKFLAKRGEPGMTTGSPAMPMNK